MATKLGRIFAAMLALGTLIPGAEAAVYTWANPGTSGAFSNPANWDLNAMPTNTDDIVLPASGTPYTVTLGDVHNGIAGNVILVNVTVGSGATLETAEPVNFFANGAISLSAGATLRRTNCPSNSYVFTGSAASSYHPDSIIEIADPQTVNFWIDMPTTVGTVVINQAQKSNPVYPGPLGGGNTKFAISGDLIVKEGRYAAAWGYPVSTEVRNLVVDGGQGTGSELRMRNGNVAGSFTVAGDVVVSNGGVLRDAAGGLVVTDPVVVTVGGDVTNSATINQLGGVFQWLFRFTSGSHTWNGAGATVNTVEDLEVESGGTLVIAGAELNLSGNSISAILDEVPGGGVLTGTVDEDPAYAGYGLIELSNPSVGLTVAGLAHLNTSGLVPVELSAISVD